MLKTVSLLPGVTLQCFPDSRFKQGALSFQIVRPMDRSEASMNAVIPAVLLRGNEKYPDMRSITNRLDDLYGASLGATVRRVGDYQTTGMTCGFIEDRFALPGDRVLDPMTDFLRELLRETAEERGGLRRDYFDCEKKNLIDIIDSEVNYKRSYSMGQMLRKMCREDSYGIPRLGLREDAEKLDPVRCLEHYKKIFRESRIDIFYVGAREPQQVAELVMPLLEGIDRQYIPLKPQTAFRDGGGGDYTETMDVSQANLCLGYVSPTTVRDPEFAAVQVMNTIFGGGMTSKLFMNVREKLSLCYTVGSSYYSSKGIILVGCGIDACKEQQAREQIALQLEAICRGEITEEELAAAKEALYTGLRSTHDSPGSIANYYASASLGGSGMTPTEHMEAVRAVTAEQVSEAARGLKLHTSYVLKGASE